MSIPVVFGQVPLGANLAPAERWGSPAPGQCCVSAWRPAQIAATWEPIGAMHQMVATRATSPMRAAVASPMRAAGRHFAARAPPPGVPAFAAGAPMCNGGMPPPPSTLCSFGALPHPLPLVSKPGGCASYVPSGNDQDDWTGLKLEVEKVLKDGTEIDLQLGVCHLCGAAGDGNRLAESREPANRRLGQALEIVWSRGSALAHESAQWAEELWQHEMEVARLNSLLEHFRDEYPKQVAERVKKMHAESMYQVRALEVELAVRRSVLPASKTVSKIEELVEAQPAAQVLRALALQEAIGFGTANGAVNSDKFTSEDEVFMASMQATCWEASASSSACVTPIGPQLLLNSYASDTFADLAPSPLPTSTHPAATTQPTAISQPNAYQPMEASTAVLAAMEAPLEPATGEIIASPASTARNSNPALETEAAGILAISGTSKPVQAAERYEQLASPAETKYFPGLVVIEDADPALPVVDLPAGVEATSNNNLGEAVSAAEHAVRVAQAEGAQNSALADRLKALGIKASMKTRALDTDATKGGEQIDEADLDIVTNENVYCGAKWNEPSDVLLSRVRSALARVASQDAKVVETPLLVSIAGLASPELAEAVQLHTDSPPIAQKEALVTASLAENSPDAKSTPARPPVAVTGLRSDSAQRGSLMISGVSTKPEFGVEPADVNLTAVKKSSMGAFVEKSTALGQRSRAPSPDRRAQAVATRGAGVKRMTEKSTPSEVTEQQAVAPDRRAVSPDKRVPSVDRRAPSPDRRAAPPNTRSTMPARSLHAAEKADKVERRTASPDRRLVAPERRAVTPDKRAASPDRRSTMPARQVHAAEKLDRRAPSPDMRSQETAGNRGPQGSRSSLGVGLRKGNGMGGGASPKPDPKATSPTRAAKKDAEVRPQGAAARKRPPSPQPQPRAHAQAHSKTHSQRHPNAHAPAPPHPHEQQHEHQHPKQHPQQHPQQYKTSTRNPSNSGSPDPPTSISHLRHLLHAHGVAVPGRQAP